MPLTPTVPTPRDNAHAAFLAFFDAATSAGRHFLKACMPVSLRVDEGVYFDAFEYLPRRLQMPMQRKTCHAMMCGYAAARGIQYHFERHEYHDTLEASRGQQAADFPMHAAIFAAQSERAS